MTPFSKFSSIQGRLGIIFLAFLVLLMISVVVTYISLETQKQDAREINLAGRQRMLLQQMSSLALGYEQDRSDWYDSALREAIASFEQTLTVMQKGGKIIDYTGDELILLPPESQQFRTALDSLNREWVVYLENVRLLLIRDQTSPIDVDVKAIETQSTSVIEHADRVVQALEVISKEKIARLRYFHTAFLGVGLLLLSAGWWVIRKSIVQPLVLLDQSADRIGSGDLEAPIILQGPKEAQVLARTMESMRMQILASRQEMMKWTSTLENRVQQRTRELEALAAVSREINSHLSIDEVLNSVAIKAQELSGSQVASLCLLDNQGKILNLHGATGIPNAFLSSQSPADEPAIGDVLVEAHAHLCGLQTCQGFCQIISPQFRTSHLVAPLRSGDKVIGALCVGSSEPDAFRPEISVVLTQLAGVTTVALENSRLYQQAEHVATLEERHRIASEMHDGLLQTLSFLGIMVQWAKDHIAQGDHLKTISTLMQIERAEEQAETEIRRAIASLQYDFPLIYTLQEQLAVLVEELSRNPPAIYFETKVILPLALPTQESEQAMRVVREALLNAQRYSKADAIYLLLADGPGEIVLTVEDKGVGFDPAAEPEDRRAHFGIKIMQARAARLGGSLKIQSAPGAGTLIQLRWTTSSIKH
jgi:two-component system nitrate/nitrite sensor histidine kinase NarX